MIYAVEAWTIPMDGDEEPCEQEMVESAEFYGVNERDDARRWAWDRMEEGFFVRIWRR